MYSTLGEELGSHGYVVAVLVPTTPARVVDGQPRTTPISSAPPAPAEIDPLLEQEAADIVALHDALAHRPTGHSPRVSQRTTRCSAGTSDRRSKRQ
jgi:hypothetical protein